MSLFCCRAVQISGASCCVPPKLAWRLVNEEVKFELPGKRVRSPEKVIELVTVEPLRVKLFTVKLGVLNERNEPIETVEPEGVKLTFVSEKPV